ncbi:MAG: NAD(P)/FAD-dependent oxidoreductase [Terriglobales bacterium]
MKKVVVIGAGFGGLYAALALGRLPVEVTVVDRKNHHTFQPLLYQVATAGLSPGEIAAPIRAVLRRFRNIEVLLGNVTGIDLEHRRALTSTFSVPYDYLIVAAGAGDSYFGHDEWETLAPGLKTIEDALEIRRRVLLAFELAERQAATEGKHEQVNFVVIGGGPTGVELAGALAEVARVALAQDFRAIDPARTRVILLEAGTRVLPQYPEELSRSAERQLQRLGVEVRTSTMVTLVEPAGVRYKWQSPNANTREQFLSSSVTLWAAGVSASPLGALVGGPLDRAGRVLVNPDLSLPGHPEVFVIGDLAALKDVKGKPVPGLAPAAIQEGQAAAKNIARDLKGLPRLPFEYHDKGSLATIGRAAAVGEIRGVRLSGFLAWLAWLFVHIYFLIGFRNRLLVLFNWAWSYLTYERAARLITGTAEMPSHETSLPSFEAKEPPGDEESPRNVA